MTLTVGNTVIEITRGHLCAHSGRRGVFIKFGSGFPLWDFARRRSERATELWGLGLYCAVDAAA